MLGTGSDQACADDDVFVVEHGRLAGRHAVGLLVELQPKTAGRRLDAGGQWLGAVAELDVRPRDRQVQPAGHGDGGPREGGAGTDDDRVRLRLRAQRVERLRRGDAEALPLAGREAPVPAVASELTAVLVHERARARVEPLALEEGTVVVAGQEARLLALAAPRDREAGALGLRPRLALGLIAERERDAPELAWVEPGQHVRLILLWIRRPREQGAPAVLDDTGVVAGDEHVGAGAAREREQAPEAERAVAAHAGVRRLAARVPSHERADDRAPEVLAQVERHVRHAERVAG